MPLFSPVKPKGFNSGFKQYVPLQEFLTFACLQQLANLACMEL